MLLTCIKRFFDQFYNSQNLQNVKCVSFSLDTPNIFLENFIFRGPLNTDTHSHNVFHHKQSRNRFWRSLRVFTFFLIKLVCFSLILFYLIREIIFYASFYFFFNSQFQEGPRWLFNGLAPMRKVRYLNLSICSCTHIFLSLSLHPVFTLYL